MSGRGGRGRGRGGPMTNGRRAVAQNSVPWAMDSDIVLDGKPSELFPPYTIPRAAPLTKKEEKQVSYFLLFREQSQDSPLYTQARSFAAHTTTSSSSSSAPGRGRTYGQDQLNKRYGQTTKATVDPFTAVPTYSHRFRKVPRTLPDVESRPFAKEFFPPELHDTLDGKDGGGGGGEPGAKRRRVGGTKTLGLSNITSYRTAEEVFLPTDGAVNGDSAAAAAGTGANMDKALQLLSTIEKRAEGGEEEGFISGEDDDDWVKGNGEGDEDGEGEVDDAYDDESGDDYNAEAYFDGNQDDEDYGDDGDDGGDYF